MMSNPNLRAAHQPSYQRPNSVVGDSGAGNGPHLPAFARNLPQDPFVGAGLVRNPVRESLALGGGSASAGLPGKASPLHPGGLVGVIASEERSRALRRGSPVVDNQRTMSLTGAGPFDRIGVSPAPTLSNNPSLTPGDQAQIQMTQQMQQFMQMQMQFMQMMASQGNGSFNNGTRPASGLVGSQSLGSLGTFDPSMAMLGMGGLPKMQTMPNLPSPGVADAARYSVMDGGSSQMLSGQQPQGDVRTMSMLQPGSASWAQPPNVFNASYAPSIHVQAAYTPSIAPSERSNVGLPGRYRPVSQMVPVPHPVESSHLRTPSNLSGLSLGLSEKRESSVSLVKSAKPDEDDDEEQGWATMKAKREKKKSTWSSKKAIGSGELGALIS